jgi:adenine-specific DNA-methyltransferase
MKKQSNTNVSKGCSGGLGVTIANNAEILPNSDFLQTLKATLPQFFKAPCRCGLDPQFSEFDMDKFAAELAANNIAESRDGYRLSFVGKDYARLQTGLQSETVIVPDMAHNSLHENVDSENVFITGDNLEVLRHLQNAYARKIKMIYIDPPYNTGKEFVYNDNFEFSDEKLKSALGYDDNEIARLRSIQGKSSHSAWLTFMYPRLRIAQKLLTDDGVIFVSIDDNEQANLKLLMDDVFGEGNFVGQFVWHKKTQPSFLSKEIASVTEYLLAYKKQNEQLPLKGGFVDIDRTGEMINIGNPFGERIIDKSAVIIANGNFTGTLEIGEYGNGVLKINLLP